MAENQKHQQTDKEKKPQKHSHQEAGRVAAQQVAIFIS